MFLHYPDKSSNWHNIKDPSRKASSAFLPSIPTTPFCSIIYDCCSLFHILLFHTWVPFHLIAFSSLIKILFIKNHTKCQLEFLLLFRRHSDHVLIITRSTFILYLSVRLLSVLFGSRDSICFLFLVSY